MPRGAQVAAAGDPETSLEAIDSGSFTRLTFSLAPGSAASASVRVSPASLRLWKAMRSTGSSVPSFQETTTAEQNLLLDFDVSVADDRSLASLSFAVPHRADVKPFAPLLEALQLKKATGLSLGASAGERPL
jgi:hypothetical protein